MIYTKLKFLEEKISILTYFEQLDKYPKVIPEIINLANMIHDIFASSISYREFMLNVISKIDFYAEEAEILEKLIPMWSVARGNQIPKDKQVDEFYFEFEMLVLWELLLQIIVNQDKKIIVKLRAIVRRYSNLPELWQYICLISGDEVVDAYTF